MVDKELIEIWRNMLKPSISSQLLKTNYEGKGEQDKEEFERDFDEILDLALIGLKHKAQLSLEDATSSTSSTCSTDDTICRQFEEIVVRHPSADLRNYTEYKGKPYFSIRYKENDEDYIGYGTYNPEVLSRYLRDYFMPPAQPEQRWIPCSERLPEDRVSVIVCFREWQQYAKRYVYGIVVGWYARKHSVHENVFSDWEGDCEYDEIEDEYYIPEGWYEFTTQGNGDLMNWYINADVVAWMELPEPYKENERGR